MTYQKLIGFQPTTEFTRSVVAINQAFTNLKLLQWRPKAELQGSHGFHHLRESSRVEGARVIAALQRVVQGEVSLDDSRAESHSTEGH